MLDDYGSVVGVLVARGHENVRRGEQRYSYAIPLQNHTEVMALIDASRSARFDPGFTVLSIPSRGVVIDRVVADGMAAGAGLRTADVIVRVNGEPVTDSDNALSWYNDFVRSSPGTRITIEIERDGLRFELVALDEPGVP